MADHDNDDRFSWMERSPVTAIHRERKAYIGKDDSDEKVSFCKYCLKGWIGKCQKHGGCIDRKHQDRAPNCSCFEDIGLSEAEMNATVDYLFAFSLLTRQEQQTLLMEWIKYGSNIGRQYLRGQPGRRMTFLLPATSHLICKDALCLLLGLGTMAWDTVIKMVKELRPPEHGLFGKPGNKRDHELEDAMKEFFERIKQQAIPRATLIVRDMVRTGGVVTSLRDEDGDLLDLPSHMSKCGFFNSLLAERGWVYSYDNRSRITARKPIENTVQKKAPSWTSFAVYWKTHYPNLVIAGSREDICNECFIYANRHKYTMIEKSKQDYADQGPEEDDEETINMDDMLHGKQLVLAAAKHVEMAQRQRLLYQVKKKEAMDSLLLPPSERVLCFVADYAQNMCLPNFASKQPGATYYYSPFNVYCFGIVDASINSLTAYLYPEDIGKKGGNNVASLLMKHFD